MHSWGELLLNILKVLKTIREKSGILVSILDYVENYCKIPEKFLVPISVLKI